MADKCIALSDLPRYVRSGMTVGIGGGPVMITPIAMIRAVLRSGARDLHVVASSTGGFGIDLMIGAGAVASVEFAQIVLNEFGPAPNFAATRRAAGSRVSTTPDPGSLRGPQGGPRGVPFCPGGGTVAPATDGRRPEFRATPNPGSPPS